MKGKGQLYRDSKNGKIAGVCAGVAAYFGWEAWLVRIIFVSAVLLAGGPFFIMAYIAAWFILDKKPLHQGPSAAFAGTTGKGWQNTEQGEPISVKSKVWQSGEPPKQAFHDIMGQFDTLEVRLRKMETYVTSSEFQLNREISRL
ncbi:envelope stress response membrane protein PspC [Lacimicrobium sp. SS2-24]|uniref:envelope stress response membrane protein PspC n=1 Tax=Lacimicrobium sp. SS2-24 TaxID=2005569 RepID=UPI000B4B2E44|nr:envelope stress response membrane protein PspC [Lacimicrobium sp. SS2-24]